MTTRLLILTIIIGCLIAILFVDIPYLYLVSLCSVTAFLIYQVIEFINVARKHFDAEFTFRRQRKPISPFAILLALIPTIGYIVTGKLDLAQIILFRTIALFDISISLLTKKMKPISILINGTQLYLNNPVHPKRDLSKLIGLSLNGFTEEIRMTFEDDDDKLYIKRTEYSEADIEKFVQICSNRSKPHLYISDNLKQVTKIT